MSRREPEAAARGPKMPSELCEVGFRHRQGDRHLDAQLCCQQALAQNPNHADSLHLMGLLSSDAEQFDHALEWIVRALKQDLKPEYLSSLGMTLRRQGQYQRAFQAFDKAVQLNPRDAELWKERGNALFELNRPADALLSLQQALALNPDYWDAACASAVILYGLDRFEEASRHLELCDALRPNHVSTLCLRAASLDHLGRFEEAFAVYQQAYALDPDNFESLNGICEALQSLGRSEEALQWFDRASESRPNLDALNNKAVAMQRLHRFSEAMALHDRVRAIDPDNAAACWNLALLQLLTGNFEAGWAGREIRRRVPNHQIVYPNLSEPMWLGKESIEGKTILLCADEGLGDTIQFARYVPMVAARGANVILVVQDPLHALLSGSYGVARCFPTSARMQWPSFDMHCPLTSLPLAFATRLDTIPSAMSYLSADQTFAGAWENALGPRDRLRVGLVWSGNPKHTNDRNRSIPLRTLSCLLGMDATFISLQKDPRPDDSAFLRERSDIVDLTAGLSDFAQTAALVSCLDLVITVDTSIAHLAGALGRPTWVLLPYLPDFRWLLDRDDSPWYPTLRLFRQQQARDYAEVIDRMGTELAAMIAARKA
ncbi:MAG: glycosyltransferase family protein [Bradyrhizobium sp.]|nr:tetratricopeptide repeat-containing glycosyltransferase family protein [Pseudomonadota bacterium]MDE2066440.1 glycosyltransferase family protein [Bradyrhizobium sp.]MDE2468943.1 glycosyltransferase family protein [Bradyrhizobium sp.]